MLRVDGVERHTTGQFLSTRGAASVTAQPTRRLAKTDEVFAPAPGSLAGRTVLITGANSGLGLESAARLAAAGADVVATARTDAKAQQAVNEIEKRTGRKSRASPWTWLIWKSVKSLPSRLPSPYRK